MLGKRTIDDINGSVGTAEKMFSANFCKAKTTFFILPYNDIIVICLLTEKKSISLKPIIKKPIFQLSFV